MRRERNRFISIPSLLLPAGYLLLVTSAVVYASIYKGYSWLLVMVLSYPWLYLFFKLGVWKSAVFPVIGITLNVLILYVLGLIIGKAFFKGA